MKNPAVVTVEGIRITPAFIQFVRTFLADDGLHGIEDLKDEVFEFVNLALGAQSAKGNFDGYMPPQKLSDAAAVMYRMLTALAKLRDDGEFNVPLN